jgi:hypothetical protein
LAFAASREAANKRKPNSQADQSERFKRAAIEAGVDATGEEFRAFSKQSFHP